MSNESTQGVLYLGRTTYRGGEVPFGIRASDRRFHQWCVGKTGTGKSTLFLTMARQDLVAGHGLAVFDPHGNLAEMLYRDALQHRPADVTYFNPADPATTIRFNPLGGIQRDKHPLAVAGLIEVFKKLWSDDWGPRLEHLLRNVLYTILDTDGLSLADIPQLLTEKSFRDTCVSTLSHESVRDFWTSEYAKYSPAFRAVVVAPLQNKLGALLTDPTLRRVLTEAGDLLDLRSMMDSGKVLIVNLDKGRLGDGPASILGSFLVSHIALAGLSRSDQPERRRRDFFVYLDEFHTFTTLSLASMLSELRKYHIGLVLAHQHLSQLDPIIRDAVFGNVGTIISFRVGAADARYLAREFAPTFTDTDLTSLPRFNMFLRLQIDGEQSKPFSARTFGSLEEIPGFTERPPA